MVHCLLGSELLVHLIYVRGKALKSVSFVLNEFSQLANIEPKLTYILTQKGGTMISVSTISHDFSPLQHLRIGNRSVHKTLTPGLVVKVRHSARRKLNLSFPFPCFTSNWKLQFEVL